MNHSSHYISCLGRELHYMEWGAPHAQTVIAWHGLARTARDMDDIAAHLAQRWRVICPDTLGRGLSQWSPQPAQEYCLTFYAQLAAALVDQLGLERVHWLGTSMGGLVGMALASQPGTPIRRLLLNDVGPVITTQSLERIATYVGTDPTWATFDEALAYVKVISAPFGRLDDAQWRHLTEHSIGERPDGRWGFLYDPLIAAPFKAAFSGEPIDLWPIYERIACPTLVVRGAESDLLKRETWQQMGERGPRAKLAEIPGVGHAPMFLDDAQIGIARDFLLAP